MTPEHWIRCSRLTNKGWVVIGLRFVNHQLVAAPAYYWGMRGRPNVLASIQATAWFLHNQGFELEWLKP